jgi:hypothetical protein
MADIVERLRIWPAADGKDGLSSDYVVSLMGEAADEIERLTGELDRLTGLLRDGAICPFRDQTFNIDPETPCPKCGMTGDVEAEDKCVETAWMNRAALFGSKGD